MLDCVWGVHSFMLVCVVLVCYVFACVCIGGAYMHMCMYEEVHAFLLICV